MMKRAKVDQLFLQKPDKDRQTGRIIDNGEWFCQFESVQKICCVLCEEGKFENLLFLIKNELVTKTLTLAQFKNNLLI